MPPRSLGVVCALALACRLALLASTWSDPSRLLSDPDSTEYMTIARNVVAGHGFSSDAAPPYRPDVRRTPIYPSLLAGVFLVRSSGVRAASVVGAILSAATVAAAFWVAWRLFGSGVAVIAAVLLAFDVTSVSYSVLILTEAAFTFLLVTAVAVLLSRPSRPSVGVRGGLLLACATLCRPAGVLLAPVSLPVCAWHASGRRQIARAYLVVNAAFVVFALSWVGRNAIVAGTPTLSSIGPVNLYFHRAAAVEAFLEGRDVEEVRTGLEQRFEAMSRGWSESAKMEWMTAHARDVIVEHPAAYARMTLAGIVRMMQSDPYEFCRVLGVGEGTAAFRAVALLASLQMWIVYSAAVIGLIAAAGDGERRRAALIPLTFVAYFVLVSGPEVYARFRVPAMPFIAILSGAGIERILRGRQAGGGP